MTSTATYTVNGMTCGHCVSSVREEVSEISGIQDVQVDLSTGKLTVTAVGQVDDAAVRKAVAEAGYDIPS